MNTTKQLIEQLEKLTNKKVVLKENAEGKKSIEEQIYTILINFFNKYYYEHADHKPDPSFGINLLNSLKGNSKFIAFVSDVKSKKKAIFSSELIDKAFFSIGGGAGSVIEFSYNEENNSGMLYQSDEEENGEENEYGYGEIGTLNFN